MRKIKTDKPISVLSNVVLLYEKMIGTREGIFAYDENFRLGFEKMLFKASERDYIQFKIERAIEINKQIKDFVYNEMVDRGVPGSIELYELVKEELKILGGNNE